VENLSGAVVVAYNLSFDRGFIQAELARCGRSWPDAPELDPLVFVRQLQRTQGSKKLGAVAARMGIALENAHRAVDDAEVAGRVLYGLATQLPARLRDLVELQRQWEAVQAQEFARWRRNRGASEDGGLLSTDANAAGSADEEADGTPSLGPAYVWGDETDPIRAMFIGFPDIGARRG
jgi:DNA polymerase III epsilon subunit-like protein